MYINHIRTARISLHLISFPQFLNDLFEPVTSRYQLSYEATEAGSRSIMCSYVPVKEMNVIDVYKSYKNCKDQSSFDFISAVLK